jgi:hypothetical protein
MSIKINNITIVVIGIVLIIFTVLFFYGERATTKVAKIDKVLELIYQEGGFFYEAPRASEKGIVGKQFVVRGDMMAVWSYPIKLTFEGMVINNNPDQDSLHIIGENGKSYVVEVYGNFKDRRLGVRDKTKIFNEDGENYLLNIFLLKNNL